MGSGFQPWISKSGQPTIFPPALYPADVNVSIPYVAPLNFQGRRKGIKFLDSVGTPECRKYMIFQIQLFERKSEIGAHSFKELSASKGWKFNYGIRKGLRP